MQSALKSHAVFLLTLAAASAAAPASACGLNHCTRPAASLRESASLSLGVDHAEQVGGNPGDAFTQTLLQVRIPFAGHWAAGARLPLGYWQNGPVGQWGWGNPLVYSEWIARLNPTSALSLGLQAELPFGDEESGIASGHAMLMPYAAVAVRRARLVWNASLGLAAQLSGDHSHHHADAASDAGAATETGLHAAHAGHATAVDALADPSAGMTEPVPMEELPAQANPHAPYEFLYRFSLAIPLERLRLEPEMGISGARVLFPEAGSPADFTSIEGALGIRIARTFLIKPRWERQLGDAGRFAWKTGVDLKADFQVP